MLETMTLEENLDRLFYLTSTMIFTPGNYMERDAVYQFNLRENNKAYFYYLVVRDKRMQDYQGKHSNPDVIIETTAEEWMKIANQTVNPVRSVMLGRTKVKGEMKLFQALGKALDVNLIHYPDETEPWERPNGAVWRKPARILVINGSPRMKNGYTYFYLNHLINGIKGARVEVEEINVYEKTLSFEPCRGCFTCWDGKREGKCVINDDALEIVQRIFDSYLTIFAFPVYIDSVPARMKALMDRQFITQKNQFTRFGNITRHPLYQKPKERYIAMFATNGFPESEHFKPLSSMFQGNARNFRSPLIAEILRPGAVALYEEPTLYPYLLKVQEALEQAGRELVEKGNVSNNLLKIIASLPSKYTKDTWYFLSGRINRLENKRPQKNLNSSLTM